ncbi:MAG: ribose-phosphate diphosphokinase [Candidatus Micrarchaeota archaeon]
MAGSRKKELHLEELSIVSPNCADIAPPSVITKRFPDGESYCRLEGIENLEGKKVRIVHRLFPNPDENLVTLLQIMYGAREAGAKHISLVIPYLPYARADKAWLTGEVVSARLLIRLLKQNGVNKIHTWDCHFLKKPGDLVFQGLDITNRCMGPRLVEYFRKSTPNAIVVSPDAGAKYLVGSDGLFMRKERGHYEESGSRAFRPVEKMEADFDVRDRDVILVDDLIAGGGTMIRAAQKCFEMGAKSVSCAATHGMFLDSALERLLAAGVSRIVTTNSIPSPASAINLKGDIGMILHGEGAKVKPL